MDQHLSPVSVEDIEAALGQVSEIKAVRVVASPEGTIQEIHVLALPTKAPKQLVRDIESTIMARFGIPVDHKKISIAQLGSDAVKEQLVPEQGAIGIPRPRIHAINVNVSGLVAAASVTLEIDGELYVGEATAPASQTARDRSIAQAALNAVDQFARGAQSFSIEDVAILRLGRQDVAVSCVTMVSSPGEESFAGSALVRQNEKDSIVRATLDAVNRRMAFLKTT
ncbi:MAG: hypothetical protein RBS78_05070 [Coriobacteriia bacterium]|jgi:hypothetical protein|nr:hypothetical protein [Coriobacteriia bacterium]